MPCRKKWKTRKRGKGRQIGSKFPVTTPPIHRQVILRDRYLRALLTEAKTHDINSTMDNLKAEANKLSRELHEAERSQYSSEAKLKVIEEVLGILEDMRKEGRTRVGDSELKAIIRSVAESKKIPPQIFRE